MKTIDAELNKLLTVAEGVDAPFEGQLIISDFLILKTCAYYIGRWCLERIGDQWCPMPYSRDTEYLESKEQDLVRVVILNSTPASAQSPQRMVVVRGWSLKELEHHEFGIAGVFQALLIQQEADIK